MRWRQWYPAYEPVSEKKARAAHKRAELQKKRPDLKPVVIEGKAIARTWWGKAWNRNLESYADYTNRIGRGRSYIRHGAVVDLKMVRGEIEALVQGSRSAPYTVTITIHPLKKGVWEGISKVCRGRLESLQGLLSGDFPRELEELFMARGTGLFPSPREIGFSCSCPDWASMCKHVAAVLYGVGARLDEDPCIFFTLRGVAMEDLVRHAVSHKAGELLGRADGRSSRILHGADLSATFGIEAKALPASRMAKTGSRDNRKKKAEMDTRPLKEPTAARPSRNKAVQTVKAGSPKRTTRKKSPKGKTR